MSEITETDASQVARPPPTIPANYTLSFQNFESEEAARQLAAAMEPCLSMISRYIDLGTLDGMTVSYDYPKALAELDRGFETVHILTPTSEFGQGVAMTPAVLRHGLVKSHIVVAGQIASYLHDSESEYWGDVLYILAHECAHVETHKVFDAAIPGVLLKRRFEEFDHQESAYLWQVVDACWGEYSACRLSAVFSNDAQTSNYAATALAVVKAVRERANDRIREYRLHGDVDRVLLEMLREYGNAAKFAAYLIGHLEGRNETLDAAPEFKALLQGHWFEPFYDRLVDALDELWSQRGKWRALSDFDIVSDIVRDLLADGGVVMERQTDGRLHVDIPISPDTIPLE